MFQCSIFETILFSQNIQNVDSKTIIVKPKYNNLIISKIIVNNDLKSLNATFCMKLIILDYIHQVQGQVNKIIEKNDTGHHKNDAKSAF